EVGELGLEARGARGSESSWSLRIRRRIEV
ncbi:hypothetical protein A2U01_0110318, partial [Trifolium medium]|nr:hypothetical protein [Trifolium medium]